MLDHQNLNSSGGKSGEGSRLKRGEHRSLGSRLLSGGIWMTGSRGIQAVCGILVSMLLARMLSPEEMGTYFILASITLFGSMLAQFGTHQAIVKLIAGGMALGDEVGVRRSLRSVFIIAGCGSAIVAGGYVLGGGTLLAEHVFKSHSVAMLTGLTALWIAMRHGQMLLSKAFRGFHDLRRAALYEGAQTQFLTVVVLAFFWFTAGSATLDEAVQATLAAFALTLSSGGWVLWRRRLNTSRWFLGVASISFFALYAMNTAGWVLAENGRQPWIVQGLLKTEDGVSSTVSTTELWISLAMFYAIYVGMGVAYVLLQVRAVRKDLPPPPDDPSSDELEPGDDDAERLPALTY